MRPSHGLWMVLSSWGLLLPVSLAQPLPEFTSTYRASAAGMRASAVRSYGPSENGRWELRSQMEVRLLGARIGQAEETSQFLWQEEVPVPEQYHFRQSGLGGRTESVTFQWENQTALSIEDDQQWQLPLDAGVQDKLSLQAWLAVQLASGINGDLLVPVADNERVELQRYRIMGEEVLETPLGRLATLRVDRIRDDDSPRQTRFWLAKDWFMLLVRLEQVSRNGREVQLSLESATVAGRPVTGLP